MCDKKLLFFGEVVVNIEYYSNPSFYAVYHYAVFYYVVFRPCSKRFVYHSFVSLTNRNNLDEFQFTYFPKIFLVIQNMNFKILRHSDPNYTVAYVVHIYIIIIV